MTPPVPQKPIGWLAVIAVIVSILGGLGIPMLYLSFTFGRLSTSTDANSKLAETNALAIQQLLIVTERLNKGVMTNEKEVDRLRQRIDSQTLGPR